MLNIEECTEIWVICSCASVKKMRKHSVDMEYGILTTMEEIHSDVVKLEQAGYRAEINGYGLNIRKAA